MLKQSETLSQILTDVLANRKNLADQVATQRQQVEVGVAQLEKFDTLIATLQVVALAPNVMDAVIEQEAANAIVSPTGAEGEANESASSAPQESAQAVSADTQSN
jgi:hypothetical protein